MSASMFIEIWAGLRDLMSDNNTTVDISDNKRFINWTIRDLAQEYDWEFLRGQKTLVASAGSGVYDLNAITQLTASANTIYVQSDSTADVGSIVTIYGKTVAASSTLDISSDPMTVLSGASATIATGANSYSHIDSIRKNATTGTITVSTATETLATLAPTDTYVSNDLNKINFITDNSSQKRVFPYDTNMYELGNPAGSNLGNYSGYDTDHEGKLRLFNVDANTSLNILYQRIPRWLVNDTDRSEFPEIFNSKIIDSSYQGYGLRYRDQHDADIGKAKYISLLQEIVTNWKTGKDKPVGRVIPQQYKRRL